MLLALAGDSAAVRGAVESGLQRTLSRYDTQFSPWQLFYYAYALGIAGVADDGRRLLSLMLSKPGPATPAWIRVDPHFASLR
jgi:hypothetical protein